MRIAFTISFCFAMFAGAHAQSPSLIVEEVDNLEMVPGNTYRIYMQLPEEGQSVHALFADDDDQLFIEATAPFYQHEMGNFSPANANEWMLENHPSLEFDSWITLGTKDQTAGYLWHAGIDFEPFLAGESLEIENGAWFFLPDAEQTLPNDQGLVLLMQLTTTGEISGTLNAQGWYEDRSVWQERQLSFSSEEISAFGCMDETALNFDENAEFDNGDCEFEIGVGIADADNEDFQLWNVFPNPSADGSFQLESNTNNTTDKIEISIFDAGGKKVFYQNYSRDDLQNGRIIEVKSDLASGIYAVNILQGQQFEVVQLLVH